MKFSGSFVPPVGGRAAPEKATSQNTLCGYFSDTENTCGRLLLKFRGPKKDFEDARGGSAGVFHEPCTAPELLRKIPQKRESRL